MSPKESFKSDKGEEMAKGLPKLSSVPVLNKDKDNKDKIFESEKIDEKIKDLRSLSPSLSPEEKVKKLYEIFAVKNGGLKVNEGGPHRPPHSIDETLAKGGDCNEFAIVLAAAMKKLGLEGGAYILRAKNAPENDYHATAYVKIGADRIIIDPLAPGLMKMLPADESGKEVIMVPLVLGDLVLGDKVDILGFTILADLSFDQLAYTYYREYGDYYRKNNQFDKAIESYEKAYKIFPHDPYVVYGLIGMHYKKGDFRNAAKYAKEYLAFENREEFMGESGSRDATQLIASISYKLAEQGIKECIDKDIENGLADIKNAQELCNKNPNKLCENIAPMLELIIKACK